MSIARETGEAVIAGYQEKGLAGQMGWGRRPAILVVDLILGFTQTTSPLGAALDTEVLATRELLDAGRDASVPVFFTTTVYRDDMRDAGLFPRKVPALDVLRYGRAEVTLDPRLGRRPDEVLIEKKYASAFFATALASLLTAEGIDTLLLCGATTSGCVRASVVDALQHGFRPIVPRSCVGDRSPAAHEANLIDIQGKYGDVVSLEEARIYLGRLGAAGSKTASDPNEASSRENVSETGTP